MGLLIILPFAAVAAWAIFAIYRWLRRRNFGGQWWRAFALLGFAGLGLGVWLAFFSEYTVANKRLDGFPIPVEIANREKPADPWVKSVLPGAIRFGGTITNLLFGIALGLVPLAVAAFFKENRGQRDAQGRPRI